MHRSQLLAADWLLIRQSSQCQPEVLSAVRQGGCCCAQALSKMRSEGLSPDTVTVCSLIVAASKAGQADAALQHFEDFCGAGGSPSTATYNALVCACSSADA